MTRDSTTSPISAEQESAMQTPGLQILTFMLDGEVFGTDISQIQEVLEYQRVTPVPRTPDFMLGVINLRGKVVPVVDLRRHFAMDVCDPTVDTCIVIVDVPIEGETTSMGLLADAVKEVIELQGSSITAAPRIGSRIDTRYISGLGEHENELIIILNLPRVFSSDEISEVFDSMPDPLEEQVDDSIAGQ